MNKRLSFETISLSIQLFASMEECKVNLLTDDSPVSNEEAEGLLKRSNELHSFIQQAVTVVQSSGKKLGGLVIEHSTKNPPTKTFSLDDYSSSSPLMSRRARNLSTSVSEITPEPKLKLKDMRALSDEVDGPVEKEERRKSFDVLDSKHDTIVEDHVSKPSTDSPKLLVTPRKARGGGMKAAHSLPVLGPFTKDQEAINSVLESVSKQMSDFEEVWSGRMKQLRQWEDVMRYREGVPRVIEWVENTGEKFLESRVDLGGSIEEVRFYDVQSYTCKYALKIYFASEVTGILL